MPGRDDAFGKVRRQLCGLLHGQRRPDPDQIEDLVQEAVIAQWVATDQALADKRPPPDPPGGAYTCRVLRNGLVRWRQRQGRRREVPLEAVFMACLAPGPNEQVEPELLARLHPELRHAFEVLEAEGDVTGAASTAGLSVPELVRRCAWAVVHLEDQGRSLPRDAGLEPCWLDRQSRKTRRLVFARPAFASPWRGVLLRDTGGSPDAMRKACERARRHLA